MNGVGKAVGLLAEVGFAAAFSASANVGASVQWRDPEHLYELVNSTIGTMRGVQEVQICPMVRRFKQEGTQPAAGCAADALNAPDAAASCGHLA